MEWLLMEIGKNFSESNLGEREDKRFRFEHVKL